MPAVFLLGPAGSGKTRRCILEARAALDRRPEGPVLLFLAPKQATFQLERQMLSETSLEGFSRLQILSFERLAHWVLTTAGLPTPRLVTEEARIMVLRALVCRHQQALTVLRGSARSPGFAAQLSDFLRLLQQAGLPGASPGNERRGWAPALGGKLADAFRLLDAYRDWLAERGLADADDLLPSATEILRNPAAPEVDALWLDGFAVLTPPEEDLLIALLERCRNATLAFCVPEAGIDGVNPWSLVADTVSRLRTRLEALGQKPRIECLPAHPVAPRFAASPGLGTLERRLAAAGMRPCASPPAPTAAPRPPLKLVECGHPEAEAELAGETILSFVRQGGRYRESAILVRDLEPVAPTFQRVFRRLGIPLFIDRREPVTHHPLPELIRSALRIAAHGWPQEEVFAVVKSGLVGLDEWEADRMENEALALGWSQGIWAGTPDEPSLPPTATRVITPIREFCSTIGARPTGRALVRALRKLWRRYTIPEVLQRWDDGGGSDHVMVGRHLGEWADQLELAFSQVNLPLLEWLPVVESAFSALTVGRVPPALDQVLLGAVDRSRNPEIRLAILSGWAEGSFPAPLPELPLLPRHEAATLSADLPMLGHRELRHSSHEAYLAYIALTRATDRVLVTWSRRGLLGETRDGSRFLSVLAGCGAESLGEGVRRGPQNHFDGPAQTQRLHPQLAAALYGRRLEASPTRLEQHARCPFQAFAERSLAASERQAAEYDARVRGTLEHRILADFTHTLRKAGMRWRDLDDTTIAGVVDRVLTSAEAEPWMRSPRDRLQAMRSRQLVIDYIRETRDWMADYPLEPILAEVRFGPERDADQSGLGPVTLASDAGTISLHGRIDRVDIGPNPFAATGMAAIVFDYKHGARSFKPRLVEAGLDLQLPLYAFAIRNNRRSPILPAPCLMAGFVYAPLKPERSGARTPGRPDSRGASASRRVIGRLLSPPGGNEAAFGGLPISRRHLIDTTILEGLVATAVDRSTEIARDLLTGNASVAPHPEASPQPCDHCAFAAACRIGI